MTFNIHQVVRSQERINRNYGYQEAQFEQNCYRAAPEMAVNCCCQETATEKGKIKTMLFYSAIGGGIGTFVIPVPIVGTGVGAFVGLSVASIKIVVDDIKRSYHELRRLRNNNNVN